jgi:hypothetical protein
MKIERQAGRKMQSPGKPRPATTRQWSLPVGNSLVLPNLKNEGTPPETLEEATGILIANPRLKFSLNHRKHSHLQISNRERIHVFHSLATSHQSLTTVFLIGSSAIRKPNNIHLYSKMRISNRRRNRPESLSCGHAFRPQDLVSSTSQSARTAPFHRALSSNPRTENILRQRAHARHFAHGFVAPGFSSAGFDLGWEDFAWPPQ